MDRIMTYSKPFSLIIWLFASLLLMAMSEPTIYEIKETFPYASVHPLTFDFGQAEAGNPITGRIEITNEGSYDLLISKVRSSCGLMIQTWPTDPVGPGERVAMTFRYDSNRPGPFKRLITIHTNAWQKNIIVDVRGEVVPVGWRNER